MLLSQPLHADSQQLLQLIDYMSVDYDGAVKDGRIVNEVEYNEMRDFSAGIIQHLIALPESEKKQELKERGHALANLVKQKGAVGEVRWLISEMRHTIINTYQIIVTPHVEPDLKQAALLYSNQCASCHGAMGAGDGPASAGMQPPPIDFTDSERYKHRNLYGLYNTVTQGVSGTGMASYSQLSDQQRWSLAFYIGSFAVKKSVKKVDVNTSPLTDLAVLTTLTPFQAEQKYGKQGAEIMAYLRSYPDALYNNNSHLVFAQEKLSEVVSAYQEKEIKKAYQLAVTAYLDGFELVEQNIELVDKTLKLEIESAMTALRNKIRSNEPVETIQREVISINDKLDTAIALLGSKSLSAEAVFVSSFFILLREGLEALLIIAALTAFLVRTKRKDGLRYIHFGWVSALILGFFTWWASISIIDISGVSREITEGVAAIVATIVLLYVGFWMHDKTSAEKWKKFIDDNMHKALTSGTLWTLSGLSFIAVYREAFETILFYQALWAQAGATGQDMALSGFISAAAVLAVLGWLIMRYSIRLPLRQFFAVTGGLMFVLAIIFAGKGIAALQEAGMIMASPVNFYHIDLLGIYPNIQGLTTQLLLIVLAIILWNKKTT